MLPWVYEFHWSVGHVLFLSVFFAVLGIIAATIVMAMKRVRSDFKQQRVETIQWEADFEDLPVTARVCRHELTGEVKHRTCDNKFDCRSCNVHSVFLSRHIRDTGGVVFEDTVFGFSMPAHRRYHRGHTWVQNDGDGIYTVGLDDFGTRLLGEPDTVELPEPGTRVHANGAGWIMKKENATLRVLAPIDGEVMERGSSGSGWYLKLRADESEEATRHLLNREEIAPWIIRELERLQLAMSSNAVGFALADGGELLPEVYKQFPNVDWDGVWGQMLLQG